jgi:hypothetical protein
MAGDWVSSMSSCNLSEYRAANGCPLSPLARRAAIGRGEEKGERHMEIHQYFPHDAKLHRSTSPSGELIHSAAHN